MVLMIGEVDPLHCEACELLRQRVRAATTPSFLLSNAFCVHGFCLRRDDGHEVSALWARVPTAESRIPPRHARACGRRLRGRTSLAMAVPRHPQSLQVLLVPSMRPRWMVQGWGGGCGWWR